MTNEINIEVPEKLIPLIVKPKPLKIAVGGRGSAKTITFSDCTLKHCHDGEKVVCAREFQNSIEESVHSSMLRRMAHHDVQGLHNTKNSISSDAGGKIIYLGLARNIGSIKSLDGANKVWIEEGQYLSQETIDILFPTIRENGSEIWISMNRGSTTDPISMEFLNKAEPELEKCGYYEDDYMIVVEINWNDNPWFPEVLNRLRLKHLAEKDRAEYDHIWEGKYSDSVKNAIIKPEWFDACIDAHIKLGFKPLGEEVVSHDPSDLGDDPKGICYRHGAVILDALENDEGDVNDGCDWATGLAIEKRVDRFIWDGGGMGITLRRQVSDSFRGKKIDFQVFDGSEAPDNPDSVYEAIDGLNDYKKTKKIKDVFRNKRSQYYIELRDRIYRTYRAVAHGEYHDPAMLISFDSRIKLIKKLRAEICRIPKKEKGDGRIHIMSKDEMRKLKPPIPSPNLADSVMMSLKLRKKTKKTNLPDNPPRPVMRG
ncbi:PBSX family phage terminase large subunit [Agarilytica rhodophyticola]|uniref:PBSX family phage terminase large subunit n=1 Tax=Agarilytica rhodophyticola TaxID=1737490 RepID=UPI000B34756B|nr:PBSX family phage terminase large subunit [Agarilytica rhodophyticola]